jgi:sugar phosphate isomerase/epimerase
MIATSDRRHFLKSTALLSLSAATGGWWCGSSARAAMRPVQRIGGPSLKLALNAYSFSKLLNNGSKGRESGLSLLHLVDFCARQGFDGFDATGYFFPGYPSVPADDDLYQLKRRAFDLGIGISGTGVRNNFTTADKAVREAGVRHIKEWVEVASRMGAPVLRVFADTQMKGQSWETVAPGCTRHQVEEWIADDLRECAEHGKKFGVIIGVQNHGDFIKTSDDHLSLVRRVDSEWCGPIVDTGYYRSADPYQDIAAVAPYAVNWQIKESPISPASEVRTDLKKLVTIIRLAGYRGYLPIETLSSSGQEYDPYDVVPKFLAQLRQAVAETASIVPPPAAEEPAAPLTAPEPAATKPPVVRPMRKPPNRNKTNPPLSGRATSPRSSPG